MCFTKKVWRKEFKPIIEWVKPKSTVLDVGCGFGDLSEFLTKKKNCEVWGLDLNINAVQSTQKKGLKASCCDVDLGLKFRNDSFNYVVLCDILEHVYKPKFVLEEALRVGKHVIVASPNIAFITARMQLLFGNFPETPLFGYKWYNTQHIHLFSYNDFKDLLKSLGGLIIRKWFWARGTPTVLSNAFPNLFSVVFVVEIERKECM